MKFKIALIIGIIVGWSCCNMGSNTNFKSKGIITGADPRMCMCCGGWKIIIDSVTYNFDSIPSSSNFTLQKETFPIVVRLDWELKSQGCSNWITIQRITKE
jgi:hypothetical protein